ncbi:MAG: PEP-CTERM system histidine kinase PrsK [Azoarcus sp.]|jgi:putative PEP-CTERM system histidine kinase|nr:PEP-CTERM system histidine kinase PrsK [Azoarcus sp.]
MNESLTLADFAFRGYGLTAVVFAGFALYLYAAWRGALVGGCLLLTVALSCGWALASLWYARSPSVERYLWPASLDVLRTGGWLVFLLLLLRPILGRSWNRFLAAALVMMGAQALGVIAIAFSLAPDESALKLNLGGLLAASVLGLVLIEQLYRNVAPDMRWALKPLCMGLGAAYMFELYLFADAFLFGRPNPVIWAVRGPVHALIIPLVAVSGARNPSWSLRISLSREAVFHSTALGLSGVYLLVVSSAGYYVRYFGGEWGHALQIMLLFAALLLLAFFMSSSSQRAKLRVFISKHLFPYRYDYRTEWLRFTKSLSAADGQVDLGQSVVTALANLVESPGGVLWLRSGMEEDGCYTIHGRVNYPVAEVTETADSPLLHFMRARDWVINLEEYRRNPAAYPDLVLPDWLATTFPDAWLLIPLTGGKGLIGFVMLAAPRTRFEINWEVLDLLKTARHQAASDLERMLVAEDLLEARKFESFTRMSAFVVHDLKNLVAQLSLMLRNAERHKDNPEFQADMLETVAHVEARMRGLMAQLQEKRSIDPPRALNLIKVLENVRNAKREQRPLLELDLPREGGALMVLAHSERLERVLGHVVQNALEATPENGNVRISLEAGSQERVRIVVEDTGCGMSEAFIRERLSRPFETTKASGMGIGVYETRRYIRELGGEVSYESTEGVGTKVGIELPLHTRLHAVGGEKHAEPGEKHG